MAYDMVIKGAKAVTSDGVIEAEIAVQNGVIAEIGSDIEASGTEIIQADGKYVFPGVIDCHVHFNEPGREDWEGFETGSQMMAAGGCTTYFDMPLNCIPSTVTAEHLLAKAEPRQAKICRGFCAMGRPCARPYRGHPSDG